MAYKQLGGLDFSEGRLKYFIKYCPDCKKKILLDRRDLSEFSQKVNKTSLTKIMIYEHYRQALDILHRLCRIKVKVTLQKDLTSELTDDTLKLSSKKSTLN